MEELDGVYFRVKRGDKWENCSFSNWSDEEQEEILKKKDLNWLRSLASIQIETIEGVESALNHEDDVFKIEQWKHFCKILAKAIHESENLFKN